MNFRKNILFSVIVFALTLYNSQTHSQALEETITYGNPQQHTNWDVLSFMMSYNEYGTNPWQFEIDMMDIREEIDDCREETDMRVDQCKSTFSTWGTTLCVGSFATGLRLTRTFHRFIPDVKVPESIAPGALLTTISCTSLNQQAHQWCDTVARNNYEESCMPKVP